MTARAILLSVDIVDSPLDSALIELLHRDAATFHGCFLHALLECVELIRVLSHLLDLSGNELFGARVKRLVTVAADCRLETNSQPLYVRTHRSIIYCLHVGHFTNLHND